MPIFENVCDYNRETLEVASKGTVRLGFKIYCFSFSGIFFLLAVWAFFTRGGVTMLSLSFLIGSAVLLYLYFIMPGTQAKRLYKKFQEIYPGGAYRSVAQFFDGNLLLENKQTGGKLPVEYSQIKKCEITGRYYLFVLPSQLFFLAKKGGFTVGDEELFLPFLKERAVNAKFIVKK